MMIQIVKLESSLSEGEVMAVATARAEQFRAIPGLIQKYYVNLGQPNQYAGIYIWESADALSNFRESELAATIPSAYQVKTPPKVEIYETMFSLRD